MKVNRVMAGMLLLVGIAAAMTNHSEKNHFYPAWKYKGGFWEGERIRYISANHLADLLYQRQLHLVILDVRGEKAYNEYHIPTARNFNLGGKLPGLDLADQVILYGDANDSTSIDLASKIPGNVAVLKGGIEEWYRLVLFPNFLEFPVRNKDFLTHILDRCRFFGGTPRHSGELKANQREDRYREGC